MTRDNPTLTELHTGCYLGDCHCKTYQPVITVYDATEVLFRDRHALSSDILRSLQNIYLCASAARFGEPHESGWVDDPEFYAEHDTAECEATP